MSKRIFCVILSAMMLAAVTGCNKKENSSVVSEVIEATEPTTEAPTEPPVPDGKEINPLTGESGYSTDAFGKRPVAVMVNNIKAALPQYGITDADVIYEVPVEGGITRLMAVYADYNNVPNICSVRSCRYYYPIIALGLDAIYCHWGADQTIAVETLNRTGIEHLDGAYEEGLFYRDEERAATYDSEHTGYLCGAELAEHFASHEFRTDINEENKNGGLTFVSEGETYTPDGQDCTTATFHFSDNYFSTFEYNEAEGTYYKQHSGNPHMDGVTGKQLEFENVFALRTSVTSRDGYLMDVQIVGEGDGYYISKGKAHPISWKKDAENLPIKVYNADGSELKLNIGECYFGIMGMDTPVDIQ